MRIENHHPSPWIDCIHPDVHWIEEIAALKAADWAGGSVVEADEAEKEIADQVCPSRSGEDQAFDRNF